MKLSKHIAHCVDMLARFGDLEAEIVHRENRGLCVYDWQPRITYTSDDMQGGGGVYEISRAFEGQFND